MNSSLFRAPPPLFYHIFHSSPLTFPYPRFTSHVFIFLPTTSFPLSICLSSHPVITCNPCRVNFLLSLFPYFYSLFFSILCTTDDSSLRVCLSLLTWLYRRRDGRDTSEEGTEVCKGKKTREGKVEEPFVLFLQPRRNSRERKWQSKGANRSMIKSCSRDDDAK